MQFFTCLQLSKSQGEFDLGDAPDGYETGETEDYLITPEGTCSLCQDRNADGKIDFDDLVELMSLWMDCCME